MSWQLAEAAYVPCQHALPRIVPRVALDLPHAAHVALARDPVCTARLSGGRLCPRLSVAVRSGEAVCRRHAEGTR